MPMTRIHVTDAVRRASKRASCTDCLIATAIRPHVADSHDVAVGTRRAEFTPRASARTGYRFATLPAEARRAVRDWDARREVGPFCFYLNIPAEVART